MFALLFARVAPLVKRGCGYPELAACLANSLLFQQLRAGKWTAHGEQFVGLDSLPSKNTFYNELADALNDCYNIRYGLTTAASKEIKVHTVRRVLELGADRNFDDKTCDLLAVYLGYPNWAAYRMRGYMPPPAPPKSPPTRKWAWWAALAGIALLVLAAGWQYSWRSGAIPADHERLKLVHTTATKAPSGQVGDLFRRLGRLPELACAVRKNGLLPRRSIEFFRQPNPRRRARRLLPRLPQLPRLGPFGRCHALRDAGYEQRKAWRTVGLRREHRFGRHQAPRLLQCASSQRRPVRPRGCSRNRTQRQQKSRLKALGVRMDDWCVLAMEILNQEAVIFINGQEALRFNYREELGALHGIQFYLKGSGAVDWVRVTDLKDNQVKYFDDFLGEEAVSAR